MRRTRATVLATIVALGWALPRPGWALSCDEIMLMLDDGLSTEVVASTLRSSAKKLSPGVVSCLAERSAPSAILEIARELAGTAAASGAAVGGGADDGWLGDQAAPPELTAPPPVAAPPAPPPAVKKPPAPAASPAGIATLGIASDGSPLVSARMYRLGWMQRLRSGLGVEGRVAFMPDRAMNDVSGLTHTLVAIAEEGSGDVDFQQPLDKMTAKVEALVDASPGRPWGLVNTTPHIRGGLWLGTTAVYNAIYDDDAAVDSPPTQLELVRRRLAYGTVVEFAQEFWSRKQIGARLVVGVHSHIAPVPVYDPDADIDESQLYNSLRVGVDVMKGVGSR